MSLKNIYTISPLEITNGDVFAVVITCHITPTGFRLYRCPYFATHNDIPQGMRIYDAQDAITNTLFPSVINAEIDEDF